MNLNVLNGKKTYLAAAGLLGLATFQVFVLGDVVSGVQSFLGAMTAAGLRNALEKPTEKSTPQTSEGDKIGAVGSVTLK